MSNLKLYILRAERLAYVLAESKEQAQEFVREVDQWEDPEVEVFAGDAMPDLWFGDNPDNIAVYHPGSEIINLKQARTYPVGRP